MGKVEPIHDSILAHQVGELSNIRGNPSRLIARGDFSIEGFRTLR
jgi:hypothetical protein